MRQRKTTNERAMSRSIIHSFSKQASNKQQTNLLSTWTGNKHVINVYRRRRRLPPPTTPSMPPLPLLLPFDLPPSSFSFLSFLTELSIHTIYSNLKPRHTVLCLFPTRPKTDTMLSSGMFWVSWEEKISMFQVCWQVESQDCQGPSLLSSFLSCFQVSCRPHQFVVLTVIWL